MIVVAAGGGSIFYVVAGGGGNHIMHGGGARGWRELRTVRRTEQRKAPVDGPTDGVSSLRGDTCNIKDPKDPESSPPRGT